MWIWTLLLLTWIDSSKTWNLDCGIYSGKIRLLPTEESRGCEEWWKFLKIVHSRVISWSCSYFVSFCITPIRVMTNGIFLKAVLEVEVEDSLIFAMPLSQVWFLLISLYAINAINFFLTFYKYFVLITVVGVFLVNSKLYFIITTAQIM